MDITLSNEFRELSGSYVVDPRDFIEYRDFVAMPYIDIPPGDFILARSVEKVRVPEGALGVLFPTSTLLRCGLVFGSGFVRPGWDDHLVLELGNLNKYRPLRLWVGDKIAAVELLQPREVMGLYTGRYSGDNPMAPKLEADLDCETLCGRCRTVFCHSTRLDEVECPTCGFKHLRATE